MADILDELFSTAPTQLDPVDEFPSGGNPAINKLQVSRDTNPDTEAENRRLSQRTGMPLESVEAAPDVVKAQVEGEDWNRFLDGANTTNQFLSDTSNARLAHDSVENLSFIEGLGNSFVRSWLGIKQVAQQVSANETLTQLHDANKSFGEIYENARTINPFSLDFNITESLYRYVASRVFDPSKDEFVRQQGRVGELATERSIFGMSEKAQTFMRNVEEQETFLGKLAAVAQADVTEFGAFTTEVGLEFLPHLITAGTVTAATRNPNLGAIALGTLSGVTERFRSPEEFLRAAGIDTTDPEQVNALLFNSELFNEAQKFGFTRGAIIGSVDALSGGLAGKALAQNPLVSLALQTSLQSGLGGGGEALAQLATVGEIDANEVIFEAVGEFATAPIEVATVGGVPVVSQIRDMVTAARARDTVGGLDQMSEALQESPLTERAPETAAEHMARVFEDNGLEEFFISSEVLQTLDAQIAEDLNVTSQLASADTYGGDVRVDAKLFSQYILQNPEVYNNLRDHIRVAPEGVTLAETAELQEAEEVVSRDTEPTETFSPDVEEVSQIAEHEAGVAALFDSADAAGFTEAQYASYIEATQRMRTDARKATEAKKLKREAKRNEKQYKKALEELRPEVEEHVKSQPVYTALQAIGRDRLDYAKVKAIFNDDTEAMKRLPKVNGRRIYTPQGQPGIDPDQHADVYGMPAGDIMLFSFLDQPTFEQAVDAELTLRVEEQFPSVVDMRGQIEEALEALNESDMHSQMLAFELARLRQMRGQKRIQRSLLVAKAKAIIEDYRITDINPAQLQTLQRRESKRARKALREGDLEAAAKHKLNQSVAFEMARESYKIQREFERGNKFMRKYLTRRQKKKGKQPGIPIEYVEHIQATLRAFKFSQQSKHSRRLQQALDQPRVPREFGETLKKWADRKKEQEGIVMHIGDTVIEQDGTIHWKNLTLNQWRDLKNTVKEIETAGREENKLRRQIEGAGVNEIVDTISTGIKDNINKRAPRRAKEVATVTDVPRLHTIAANVHDKFDKLGINIAHTVLNTDSLLRNIDGWESLGPAYTFIKGGIDRAYSEGYMSDQVGYAKRMKQESAKLVKLFDMFSKSERLGIGGEQDIPGVRQRLTKFQQIGVLLNMGNAENIKAMIDSGQFTEAELRAVVDNASQRDLDLAQDFYSVYAALLHVAQA